MCNQLVKVLTSVLSYFTVTSGMQIFCIVYSICIYKLFIFSIVSIKYIKDVYVSFSMPAATSFVFFLFPL